ncbi:DUF116 domain-containing protein [bacterium]|nr:DUF116 domain-containing protein [bacterium]
MAARDPICQTKDLTMQKQEWVFIFLLVFCWVCLSIGIFFFWRLTFLGLQQIHPILPRLIGIILAGFILLVGLGIALFLRILILGKDSWYSYPLRRLVTRYLFPLMVIVGRLFRIQEERIQQSFVIINNRMVKIKGLSVHPDRIIILLPQCLQNDDCKMRITKDIRCCKKCGKCQIGEIIPLLDKYNIMCWVATGGTLARKYIAEYRPDAVIAIACPRDLSSGIIDCFPIPVYGILNQRPEGPCVNTLVDMDRISWAIQNFVSLPKQ